MTWADVGSIFWRSRRDSASQARKPGTHCLGPVGHQEESRAAPSRAEPRRATEPSSARACEGSRNGRTLRFVDALELRSSCRVVQAELHGVLGEGLRLVRKLADVILQSQMSTSVSSLFAIGRHHPGIWKPQVQSRRLTSWHDYYGHCGALVLALRRTDGDGCTEGRRQ